MSDTLTDRDTVGQLRALLSYELHPHVSVQTGAGTNAPAAVFADSDFEIGDGVCGLHACGKQANEPCIPYVRADALMHALAEKEAAVAAAYEDAAQLVEQVRDERCERCGNPRHDHPYRQMFVSTGSPMRAAAAIRARGNTDALAARDTRVKAEALREAAEAVAAMAEAEGEIGNLDEQSLLGAAERTILALIPNALKD